MRAPVQNTFYHPFDCTTLDGRKRPEDYRTPFQIDRDRIIYTSAFRRLQSKTQVFLSGEYDFYRTRLTHSLEVAQIGRSIATRLRETSDLLDDDFFIDPDLVEAACLAHDIGHPPFGHAGERVLHRLMAGHGGFEGNAQTLRLLTETIWGDTGMDPTRAFLDATLKYKTLLGETPDADNHFLYDPQRTTLEFTFDNHPFPAAFTPGRKRNGLRSIECQIMDWADDTAYSLNDIVDGNSVGFLSLESIERWAEGRPLDADEDRHLGDILNAIRRQRLEPLMGRKIGDFIQAASLEKSEGFLSDRTNRYAYRLVVDPAVRHESSLYKRLAFEIVFRSPQLQQLDLKAHRILGELFELYRSRYIEPNEPAPGHLQLLPAPLETAIWTAPGENERARLVCDYLAAMTDRHAVHTWKRMVDPDFGSIIDLV